LSRWYHWFQAAFVSLAGGEDFRAHVPAGLGPFIVLLAQHGADEAGDSGAAGEDADHVGPAADLLVQPFLGVAGPDLRQTSRGKAVKARMSSRASSGMVP
jgi:hypothetical protein